MKAAILCCLVGILCLLLMVDCNSTATNYDLKTLSTLSPTQIFDSDTDELIPAQDLNSISIQHQPTNPNSVSSTSDSSTRPPVPAATSNTAVVPLILKPKTLEGIAMVAFASKVSASHGRPATLKESEISMPTPLSVNSMVDEGTFIKTPEAVSYSPFSKPTSTQTTLLTTVGSHKMNWAAASRIAAETATTGFADWGPASAASESAAISFGDWEGSTSAAATGCLSTSAAAATEVDSAVVSVASVSDTMMSEFTAVAPVTEASPTNALLPAVFATSLTAVTSETSPVTDATSSLTVETSSESDPSLTQSAFQTSTSTDSVASATDTKITASLASATANATAIMEATEHNKSSDNGAKTAGIVVGALVGAAMLGAVLFWLYRNRRQAQGPPMSVVNGNRASLHPHRRSLGPINVGPPTGFMRVDSISEEMKKALSGHNVDKGMLQKMNEDMMASLRPIPLEHATPELDDGHRPASRNANPVGSNPVA